MSRLVLGQEVHHLLHGALCGPLHTGRVVLAPRKVRVARLDDALTVETALINLGAASVRMRQVIRRNEEEVARFTANVACTGPDGKPMRMPAQLREALQAFVSHG